MDATVMNITWDEIVEFLKFEIIGDEAKGGFHLNMWMILIAVLAIVIASILLRLVKKLFTRRMDSVDKLKFDSVFKFFNYLVYIIVLVIALNSAGVNLTALLTASAALFVGIGFALQDFFKDLIAGVAILIDKSLQVNDIIEMNDKVGKIVEIKLRSTRAITRDDKILVIPNHLFLTEVIYNYTQNHSKTREMVGVGVAYGSDTALVEKVLLKCVDGQSGILKSPAPFVMFNNFGDSSLDFGVYFFVRNSFTDPRLKSTLRFAIDKAFRENNISIPFPQRDVHFFNHSKAEKIEKTKNEE